MTIAATLAAIPRTSFEANERLGDARSLDLGCDTYLERAIMRTGPEVRLRWRARRPFDTLVSYRPDGSIAISGPRPPRYDIMPGTAARIRPVLPLDWTLRVRRYSMSDLCYRGARWTVPFDAVVTFTATGLSMTYGSYAYDEIDATLAEREQPRPRRRLLRPRRFTLRSVDAPALAVTHDEVAAALGAEWLTQRPFSAQELTLEA